MSLRPPLWVRRRLAEEGPPVAGAAPAQSSAPAGREGSGPGPFRRSHTSPYHSVRDSRPRPPPDTDGGAVDRAWTTGPSARMGPRVRRPEGGAEGSSGLLAYYMTRAGGSDDDDAAAELKTSAGSSTVLRRGRSAGLSPLASPPPAAPQPPRPAPQPQAAAEAEAAAGHFSITDGSDDDEDAGDEAAHAAAVLDQVERVIAGYRRQFEWELQSCRIAAEEAQRGWRIVRTALADAGVGGLHALPERIVDLGRVAGPSHPDSPSASSNAAAAPAGAATERSVREERMAGELKACRDLLETYRAEEEGRLGGGDGPSSHHHHLLCVRLSHRREEQMQTSLADSHTLSLRLQRLLEEERTAHAQTRIALRQATAPADLPHHSSQQQRRPQESATGSTGSHHPPRTVHTSLEGGRSTTSSTQLESTLAAAQHALAATAAGRRAAAAHVDAARAFRPRTAGSADSPRADSRHGRAHALPPPPASPSDGPTEEEIWATTREVLLQYSAPSTGFASTM